MLDIICFGEPMVELVARAPQSSRQSSQQAQQPAQFDQGFGGDTSNTAIAAARQGARVGYLCSLGEDMFGDALLKLWKTENIDTREVIRNPHATTGIYFIQPHPQQRHFTYYRKDSAASQFSTEQLPLVYLSNSKILHVSAISQAISANMAEAVSIALQHAQAQGVTTSYDTNLRLQLWDKEQAVTTIWAAMAHTDIVFPSNDEVTVLTGLTDRDQMVDFFLAKGPHTVVLKCGNQGAYVATAEQRHTIAPVTVTAVDSTGAGDAFAGAFLAAYSRGEDLLTCSQKAAQVAAMTVAGYGAIAPIPRLGI